MLGKLLGAKYLKTIGHILDYIRYFAASWECVWDGPSNNCEALEA